MIRRALWRLFLTCLLVVLAVATGGVANAYWSNTGSGTGTGTSGTTVAVTLTPGSATASLYPGGTSNVVLSVSNPNLSTVFITSLALDTSQGTSGYAVDGGHSGCSLAALTYTTATNGGAGWTVPAKVGAVNGTLAITLTTPLAMGAAAANACQGASFTVYLAAS
ncbi:MAG: hypothetical protein QOE58_1334 [Actinomycetota bacterium]|jgi:hypothetical protein|nr:hypothetical protein [Actinomycetota bacterium]